MPRIHHLLLLIPMLALGCQTARIKRMAPTETLPADTQLSSLGAKRALAITAHDDDVCAMIGTFHLLHKAGWEVQLLCLPSGDPVRDSTHAQLWRSKGCAVAYFPPFPSGFRLDAGSDRIAYLPVPRDRFPELLDIGTLREHIIGAVQDFRPSVIFSLDHEIGGYGHPEHVAVSQAVVDLLREGFIPAVPVYQAVFTDHMETAIMDDWLAPRLARWGFPNTYAMAKEIYGVPGMPAPDVEIDIRAVAEEKMAILRGYGPGERNALRKFMPYYEEVDAQRYFEVFDREFFRVLRF